jgi:hypothetical protein
MGYTVYFNNFQTYVRSQVDVETALDLTLLWGSWSGKWMTDLPTNYVPEVNAWESFDGRGQARGQALVVKNVKSGRANREALSWEAFIFHPNAPMTRKIVTRPEDVESEIFLKGGWTAYWHFDDNCSTWVLRVISTSTGNQISTAVLVPRKVARKIRLRRTPRETPTISRGWDAARLLMDEHYTEGDEWDAENQEFILPIIRYDLEGRAVDIV